MFLVSLFGSKRFNLKCVLFDNGLEKEVTSSTFLGLESLAFPPTSKASTWLGPHKNKLVRFGQVVLQG